MIVWLEYVPLLSGQTHSNGATASGDGSESLGQFFSGSSSRRCRRSQKSARHDWKEIHANID